MRMLHHQCLAHAANHQQVHLNKNHKEIHMIRMFVNVSSVVEFQRWRVLKSKIFGQKPTYSKETFVNPSTDWSLKSIKILYVKKHLYLSKFFTGFRGKFLDHYRSCPIFDKLSLNEFTKHTGFLWVCWFLAKYLAF